MRQVQMKKEKDKVAIVLMLSFAVIALTSIFAVKANIDKIKDNAMELPVSEETKTENPATKNAPTKNQYSSKDVEDASSNVPTVDSLDNNKTVSDFINPVNSEKALITNPYSMDKLIYSVTLDQYMTHCGTDIEAPEDSQVLAIAQGIVTSIYEDDRYGTSIEITHSENLVSVYSNLSTSEMVEVGDTVTQGQIIGGVGSTGLFESLEPAHLHFELIKDGAYINPADYVNF